jgi:hypothetical protein
VSEVGGEFHGSDHLLQFRNAARDQPGLRDFGFENLLPAVGEPIRSGGRGNVYNSATRPLKEFSEGIVLDLVRSKVICVNGGFIGRFQPSSSAIDDPIEGWVLGGYLCSCLSNKKYPFLQLPVDPHMLIPAVS